MIKHPIHRILVPTDMSEFATLALEYALLIRARLGSQITLLYAEEFEFLLTAEYPVSFYFDNVTAAKSHAHELLRNCAKRHIADMTGVRTLVVDQVPARAIVNTADDINADLIIMGTHGRHGLRGTLLGSVTERVLRDTGRPLLTVLPSTARGRAVAIRKILCPVNDTAISDYALDYARTFAEVFDAEMDVINVPADDAASRVLEIADRTDVDLIVIGAQHTRFSDATVIGTTTERITRFAKQPVLTVMRHVLHEKEREVDTGAERQSGIFEHAEAGSSR